jgi:hypothetical protein
VTGTPIAPVIPSPAAAAGRPSRAPAGDPVRTSAVDVKDPAADWADVSLGDHAASLRRMSGPSHRHRLSDFAR